jgi:hypothetical protein
VLVLVLVLVLALALALVLVLVLEEPAVPAVPAGPLAFRTPLLLLSSLLSFFLFESTTLIMSAICTELLCLFESRD